MTKHLINRALAQTCIILIQALRPLLGPSGCCIYPWSCYDYGITLLRQEPFLKACMLIFYRVLSCNPFSNLSSHLFSKLSSKLFSAVPSEKLIERPAEYS